MRGVVRWSVRGLLLVVVVGVGLWGYLEGRQWLLRSRAERLLADIRSLDVSRSTGADAQRIEARWRKWSFPSDKCAPDACSYQISINDRIPFEYGFGFDTFEGFHPFARVLDRLGIRTSVVRAFFDVRGGVVTVKEFSVDVSRPVRLWEGPDHVFRSEISAGVREGANFWGVLPSFYSGNIYSMVRTWPHGTLMAESTPQEPLQHRESLMDFHLSCITQWSPCLDAAELLPEAGAEFAAWSKDQDRIRRSGKKPETEIRDCAGRNLEFLGRQSHEVWIVTAELRPDQQKLDKSDPPNTPFVLPQQILKGKDSPTPGVLLKTYGFPDQYPPIGLNKTARLLLFGDIEEFQSPFFFQAAACSFTPVTPEKLADVNRGITEDFDRQIYKRRALRKWPNGYDPNCSHKSHD